MGNDIRAIGTMNRLISYFVSDLNWDIDLDDFEDIDDISYDFEAEDLGLKEEAFARIKSLRQLRPLVDGQRWGIFSVEFDSKRFEVTALRKVLSGLIPKKRNSADHAVWDQRDLLFICFWGEDNNRTIGIAHFEDKETGLPQIKMIYCAPAIEDSVHIKDFEVRLKNLEWPVDITDTDKWHDDWSNAFTTGYRQVIHDVSTLTVRLAEEARGIRNRILETLEIETDKGYVHQLYEKFKDNLIHDMTETQFADMYAQTVVYGLFSARCMDETQDDFSAAEAIDLIPSTNPFLKSLMRECLGSQNNSKLSYDELEIGNVVDLLLHTKTDAIIRDFNRQTGGGREDPVIHFYEEFLTAYDKDQKVQRGVYYTPQPVVNFIVRAVDSILKSEFGLEDGLASAETKKIKYMRESKKKVDGFYRTQVEDTMDVPAVQILDPSTGTGTFLRQTILQIYEDFKEKNKSLGDSDMKKAWNEYVPKHLLPRLNGFELMMAPYAVAHMKLAMVLKDTGYDFKGESRLNVFLTNTLEEPGNSDNQLSLFDDPLASESIAANAVKKNSGINVVIGNPPYSSSSSNKSEWILNLIADYKNNLKERKINLDDDYIKFIRFGESVIEHSSNGVLAYISNNSFLDGLTHRVMRQHLIKTFDTIYIINLHGNVKKKEQTDDGGKDENVFDIQQGVSINIFVKNNSRNSQSCKVMSFDLKGSRDLKYKALNSSSDLKNFQMKVLKVEEPNFFFVPKDFSLRSEWEKGIEIEKLFPLYNSGIQTKCDSIAVAFTEETLRNNLAFFKNHTPKEIEEHFSRKSNSGWSSEKAKKDVETNDSIQIRPYLYRPFDIRYVIYSNTSSGIIGRPRASVMDQMCYENVSLITVHFQTTFSFQHAMVTEYISDLNSISMQTGEQSFVFPLYQYNDLIGEKKKTINIDASYAKILLSQTGYEYLTEEHTEKDVFSYVYACLYAPTYRAKFKELLKIGFPRIPIPKTEDQFRMIANIGNRLMQLHLMQSNKEEYEDRYVKKISDRIVNKYGHKENYLYINKESWIEGVSTEVWDMYIGGYQPLQKWLKERKGMTLSDSDISNLLHIAFILSRTSELMEEIDASFNI